LRESGVLRAAAQMVAKGIDGKAFARAFVMLELLQVRDIQSQILTVVEDPVLLHLVLLKAADPS
jgi:hypothetical protein